MMGSLSCKKPFSSSIYHSNKNNKNNNISNNNRNNNKIYLNVKSNCNYNQTDNFQNYNCLNSESSLPNFPTSSSSPWNAVTTSRDFVPQPSTLNPDAVLDSPSLPLSGATRDGGRRDTPKLERVNSGPHQLSRDSFRTH